MSAQKFYVCEHCGNIIAFVKNSGVPVMCCGQKMNEIIPNTAEASAEKHTPFITVSDNTVTVTIGSVPHPMNDDHFIQWISLETVDGNQRKELKPGLTPTAVFALSDGDAPVAAYAYCNVHGLWKSII